MKTEKQVEQLAIEKGKEFHSKVDGLDRIKVTQSQSSNWFSDLSEDADVVCTPIIKNGVLIISYDDFSGYVVFDTDFKENFFTIQTDIFNDIDGVFTWSCLIQSQVSYTCKQNQVSCTITGFDDPMIQIMERQRKPGEAIRNYYRSVVNDYSEPLIFLLRTMSYINWLMQHPQYKEIEANERKKRESTNRPNKKTNNVKKKDSSGTRTIKINNIRFITTSDSVIRGLKSKKRRISIKCWGVRGHFRHYKNGRVIYIRPYKKGVGHKGDTKEYIV